MVRAIDGLEKPARWALGSGAASLMGEKFMVTEKAPATPSQLQLWTFEEIHGQRSIPWPELRRELIRFSLEKFDAAVPLVAQCLDDAYQSLGTDLLLDAEKLAGFRKIFLETLSAKRFALGFSSREGDAEVIPMRSYERHWQARSQAMIRAMALTLRRLEHSLGLSAEQRVRLLELMVETRAVDEELKKMYYPGVDTPIPGRKFGGKGFRSTWQEAIVGVGMALEQSWDEQGRYQGDFAGPMIRDLGVGIAMGYPARAVMAAQLGKAESPMNGGRPGQGGRDLHWGDLNQGLLTATAPLSISPSTMVGLGLASLRRGRKQVAVSFIGEGGSSQGDWYEALNFAGVRRLPMIFLVENNRVALGTDVSRQSAVEFFADKAAAAGLPSFTIPGHCPETLYSATRAAREYALSEQGGPVLIGVEIMRGCGHAHHDDDRYRRIEGDKVSGYADHEAYEYWSEKEPLSSYPRRLLSERVITEDTWQAMQAQHTETAQRLRDEVESGPWAGSEELGKGVQIGEDAATQEEVAVARSESWQWSKQSGQTAMAPALTEDGSWTYRVAIEEALCEAAERYGEDFLLVGEDLEYGGAFGVTQRLKSRGHEGLLLDSPLAESCIVGSAVGAALSGLRVMAEIQFNAFAAHAFSQIVNNAASLYWRYGAACPLVLRIPVGAGLAGGPYHALSNEAWFTSTPGLKILYPSTPHDAYHGLLEAIADPAPVIFLEHLTLYPPIGRSTAFGFPVRQTVDVSRPHSVFAGADLKREGEDLTIVTYGAMVHFALRAAQLVSEGLSVEVVDLRSLWPLDVDACVRSVQKTGRLVVLHEAQHRGGYGHYIQSRILERCFMDLDAPPLMLGAMDIPPPFAPHLERDYMPSVEGIARAVRDVMAEAGRNRG